MTGRARLVRAPVERRTSIAARQLTLGELDPASPWCQRWTERRTPSWRHRSEGGFSADRYGVAALSETAAKEFILTFHYSGSYPAARLRYGMWDLAASQPELVGVAVFSIPASRATLTNAFPDLDPYMESLELGRFVLTESVPANGESWFLAQASRLAAAEGVRGVVSFADPRPRLTLGGDIVFPGHLGIIYMASNCLYAGRTTARTLTLLPDATVLSERAMAKVRNQERGHDYVERQLIRYGAAPREPGDDPAHWLSRQLPAIGARRIRHDGNHRYLMRLGNRAQRTRTRIGLATRSYPRQLDSV
ncbi:Mom family adenine methylcarbamoylation protein [Streptosporangium sandarakinum]|uniref:Mom family adenine methylcarbamoylation protein n=1 Tax=Streptosporangium sandarakinum TaxID=1260955 RepID=UPI0037890DC4